jgi:hypothetical protein
VEIIQIVLDSDLLRLADRAAKKLKMNRSALFRQALRAHLKQLDLQQKEDRDRDGYVQYPDSLDEPAAWYKVADWPADCIEARSGSTVFRRRIRNGQSSS